MAYLQLSCRRRAQAATTTLIAENRYSPAIPMHRGLRYGLEILIRRKMCRSMLSVAPKVLVVLVIK